MKYTELKIQVNREYLDDVLAELAEEGFDGVMIDDPDDVKEILDHPDTYKYDYINDELKEGLDRRPVITLYFGDDEKGCIELEWAKQTAMAAVRKDKPVGDAGDVYAETEQGGTDVDSDSVVSSLGNTRIGSEENNDEVSLKRNDESSPISFVVTEAGDDSTWLYKWQEFFKPTKVGERIVVKPSWEDYTAAAGEFVIEMDPGMAFGSGLHETTSMCIKALEKAIDGQYEGGRCGAKQTAISAAAAATEKADNTAEQVAEKIEQDGRFENCRVLDVGTGTGILAIAAALLGAGECLGIDIDEDAVSVARANIEHNGLEDRITAQYGDLTEGVDFRADIVVANLMADLVIRLTPDIKNHLSEGGIYITSGILDIKEEACRQAIEDAGFKILEVLRDGEWRAIAAAPVF